MGKKKRNTDLPVYQMEVDDEDETGVMFISIVDKPAIGVKGYTFEEDDEEDLLDIELSDVINDLDEDELTYLLFGYWPKLYPPCHPNCQCQLVNRQWTLGDDPCPYCVDRKQKYDILRIENPSFIPRTKDRSNKGKGKNKGRARFEINETNLELKFAIDSEQRIIAAPTMIPNMKIYRNQDGMEFEVVFSAATIKQIVQKFVKKNNNRAINFMHSDTMVPAYIQEHWIIENQVYDKSKIYGFDLPIGTHFMLLKIEDQEFWDTQVKGEGMTGFSIEGIFGHKLLYMSEEE